MIMEVEELITLLEKAANHRKQRIKDSLDYFGAATLPATGAKH
jgi:hypothetical protein